MNLLKKLFKAISLIFKIVGKSIFFPIGAIGKTIEIEKDTVESFYKKEKTLTLVIIFLGFVIAIPILLFSKEKWAWIGSGVITVVTALFLATCNKKSVYEYIRQFAFSFIWIASSLALTWPLEDDKIKLKFIISSVLVVNACVIPAAVSEFLKIFHFNRNIIAIKDRLENLNSQKNALEIEIKNIPGTKKTIINNIDKYKKTLETKTLFIEREELNNYIICGEESLKNLDKCKKEKCKLIKKIEEEIEEVKNTKKIYEDNVYDSDITPEMKYIKGWSRAYWYGIKELVKELKEL